VPTHDAELVLPAALILFIDSSRYYNDNSLDGSIAGWQPFICSRTNVNTAARHFGGADIAFADGHVKWETMYFYHPRPGESADSSRMQQLWEKQYQH